MLANDAAVLAKFVLLVFGLGFAGMLLQAAMNDHNRHNVISAKSMDPSDSPRRWAESAKAQSSPPSSGFIGADH